MLPILRVRSCLRMANNMLTVRCASSSATSSSTTTAGPLPISLPDLAPHEERYILGQLKAIRHLSPQDTAKLTWQQCLAIIRMEFRNYHLKDGEKQTKRDRFVYKRVQSRTLALRMCAALRDLGVDEQEVNNHQGIFAFRPHELPRLVHTANLLDVPLLEVTKKRFNTPLRGRSIHVIMDEIIESLISLEMIDPEVATVFDTVRFAPTNCGFVTHKELQERALKALIKHAFPEETRVRLLKLLHGDLDSPPPRTSFLPFKGVLDVRSLLRNQHIMTSLFPGPLVDRDNLFSDRLFERLAFYLCPLETLVILNDFYLTLSEHDPNLEPDVFLQRLWAAAGPSALLNTILYPTFRFPHYLRMKMLKDIGFLPEEAAQVLLTGVKTYSHARRIQFNSPEYVPELKERLRILRPNSEKLALFKPSEMFEIITKWDTALMDLNDIIEAGENHSQRLILKAQGRQKSICYTNNTMGNHPSYKLLRSYFGKDCEELKFKRCEAVVHVNQRRVELSQINSTIGLLEEKGFTKLQMRKALPLLYFNSSLVEEGLKAMKEAEPDLDWEEELKKDYVLQMCLYYVEKCFDFRPDGFLVGFQPKLTDELLAEIKKVVGGNLDQVDEKKKIKVHKEYEEDEDVPIHNESVIKFLASQQRAGSNVLSGYRVSRINEAKRGMRQLHTSSRPDQARGDVLATFYYQAGSGGTNIVGLRNPLRELQVKAEFKALKQWDPSVSYETFVEAAKEAAATVTTLLGERRYSELEGLITKRELGRLRTEVETEWDEVVKNNIAMDGDDVKLAFVNRVEGQAVADMRLCTVAAVCLAAKPIRMGDKQRNIVLRMDLNFFRDYSEGQLPSWTISKFKVKPLKPYYISWL